MIGCSGRDDFPLPLWEMPALPEGSSRRIQQRRGRLRVITGYANNCVRALNNLSVSFSREAEAISRPVRLPPFIAPELAASSPLISASQKRLLENIISGVQRLVGRESGDRLSESGVSLAGHAHSFCYNTSSQSRVPLVASNISLPTKPGSAHLLDMLPPDLRALYTSPEALLRSPAELAKQPSVPAPSVFAPVGQFVPIVRRLMDLEMVDFTTQPRAINGLFGVTKDDGSTRLILDARPANLLFNEPDKVLLPTPEIFSKINTDLSSDVFVAKIDLDNFFHRFYLPESFRPFFSLPAVRAADVGLGDKFGADTMIRV